MAEEEVEVLIMASKKEYSMYWGCWVPSRQPSIEAACRLVLSRFGIGIKDMEGVLKGLSEKGIGVVQQGDYTGGRYTYLDSSQALGVVIELLENLGA